MQAFVYQLVQGFSEDIAFPNLGGILLKLVEQVGNQLLRLLLRPDDGGYFGGDLGLHQVDRRRRRLKPDAVFSALLDDLRLLEGQLLQRRHDDAVPGLLNVVIGRCDLVIFFLDIGKLHYGIHQAALVVDGQAGFLSQHLVKQVLLQRN